MAAWGAIPRGDLEGAAVWLRRGAAAIERGSRDDGLVVAAAMHHVVFGGQLAVDDAFLQRSTDDALRSGELDRQVWVLAYAGRADEALAVALTLGNKLLIALARVVVVLTTSARDSDEESRWEALESYWESAQRCHSYLMVNQAAHLLGAAHIRAGAAIDGLLLLRAPARDWLLRGDTRVWGVLHSLATGLAASGDLTAAARLVGCDRRPTPHVRLRHGTGSTPIPPRCRPQRRGSSQARTRRPGARRRCRRRRGTPANRGPRPIGHEAARPTDADASDLTARQQDVATLVARGFTNKQIAHRLGISRFTAETHVRNILERLGAASRTEIATWAARRQQDQPAPPRRSDRVGGRVPDLSDGGRAPLSLRSSWERQKGDDDDSDPNLRRQGLQGDRPPGVDGGGVGMAEVVRDARGRGRWSRRHLRPPGAGRAAARRCGARRRSGLRRAGTQCRRPRRT